MLLVHASGAGVDAHGRVLRKESALLDVSEDAASLGFADAAEHGDLLLAETVMVSPEIDDLRLKPERKDAGSSVYWRCAPFVQSIECAVSSPQ